MDIQKAITSLPAAHKEPKMSALYKRLRIFLGKLIPSGLMYLLAFWKQKSN